MSQEILDEAYQHFMLEGRRYEYGRGDITLHNKSPDGHTDPSRNEQDLDGDGLYGVDCSSLVWRGLKNAGYDVGNTPFSTGTLFQGDNVTAYSRKHFDVIPADQARQSHGDLQPGDILMFTGRHGQHVGIFKGYDAQGHIQFFGSQVSTGPAVTGQAGPGEYWNGRDFHIVGALRAKPEFQIAEPLHGRASQQGVGSLPAPHATTAVNEHPVHTPAGDHVLKAGASNPAVGDLQRQLNALGITDADQRPLRTDDHFGDHTRFAVKTFQRTHGLAADGEVGPQTLQALRRAAEHPAIATHQLDHAGHPGNALFRQGLEKVQELNAAHGVALSPRDANFAGALATAAAARGMTQIDHVVFDETATHAFAVQGRLQGGIEGFDQKIARVNTIDALQTPLCESSKQWSQAAQQGEQQTPSTQLSQPLQTDTPSQVSPGR